MFIGIIIAIVIIGLFIGACAAGVYFYDEENTIPMFISILLAIALAITFVIVPFSIRTVDAGEIAVVKHYGKVTGIRESGLHYDLWLTNKYVKYDAKVQNVEITTAAYSSDAQTMDIQMTLQYEIVPDKVVNITNKYGNLDALETRITSIVVESTKSVLSGYKAMDIIANRFKISPEVEGAVRNNISDDYHVHIVAVVVTNIDFSDVFEKAVEDKMIAEQKKLQISYENEAKLQTAETEAQTKILKAEAEAKANELLETSITDKILRQKYIEKWDGKLPEVMTGDTGDLGLMINK